MVRADQILDLDDALSIARNTWMYLRHLCLGKARFGELPIHNLTILGSILVFLW